MPPIARSHRLALGRADASEVVGNDTAPTQQQAKNDGQAIEPPGKCELQSDADDGAQPKDLAWRTHGLRQLDNLIHTLYVVIHRDLNARMVFLDPSSHCFRSFIGCIRTFRLPIHLKAKSAAVRLPALRGRLRDGFLRRGWHGYGLGSLSRRGWHLMVSSLSKNVSDMLPRSLASHVARWEAKRPAAERWASSIGFEVAFKEQGIFSSE
jgi:hypothetical protein